MLVAAPLAGSTGGWTIERTGAWLDGFRRLHIRYERDSERFYALAMLACAVVCLKALQQRPW